MEGYVSTKMLKKLNEIYRYREMIYSLVKRDLRGKYKASFLGFLWTFINPLCQILVYTFVFSYIMRTGIEQFYVYLISGMIPWIFFSTSVGGGTMCVKNQSEMVKKIYFPREVLPISFVTSQFVNMLFCFIMIFLIIGVSGRGFNGISLLFLPLVMIIEYVMALGFSMIVSAMTIYFRDMEHITSVILMAWIYLTPIMYSIEMVPERLRPVYYLNPMTPVIQSYQNILYYKSIPTMFTLGLSGVFGIAILLIGWLVFSKLEKGFAEEL